MKRILFLMLILCQCLGLNAAEKAPKWMNKAKNALVSITTYDKVGKELRKGFGFYVSETGEAVSSYELFKGAYKATVVGADGQTTSVKRIIGADEMYDVLKFQVEEFKKISFLPIATVSLENGADVFRLAYSTEKKPIYVAGKVTEVSKLKDTYKYYKIAMPMESTDVNLPLLNAEGEVLALTQADAGGDKKITYGLSAAYAYSLMIPSTAFLNSTYTSIGIRKSWPKDIAEASVALYLSSSMETPKEHTNSIFDFIETFPDQPDGYLALANHYAFNRKKLAGDQEGETAYLQKALEELENSSKYVTQKGKNEYNKAKLIFDVVSNDTTLINPSWTMDVAIEAINKAIEEENDPFYHQLRGDIFFVKHQYEDAYNDYMFVNKSSKAQPATFFMASKARQNIPGFNIGEVVALLDSAIVNCTETMNGEKAEYVLNRIDWRIRLSQYKEAVEDYDLYLTLMEGKVAPNFYFLREQAKVQLHDLTGALSDIQMAIASAPNVAEYYAEEASLYVRMQKYSEALICVDNALKYKPDFGACYRLRGVCYLRLKNKEKALEALKKANELGDAVALKLIEENSK